MVSFAPHGFHAPKKKTERERDRALFFKNELERKRSLQIFALQFALFLQFCAILKIFLNRKMCQAEDGTLVEEAINLFYFSQFSFL